MILPRLAAAASGIFGAADVLLAHAAPASLDAVTEKLRQAGARTLGQDEGSCVVYGMPRAAFELGAVERQLSLPRLAPAILELCAAGAHVSKPVA